MAKETLKWMKLFLTDGRRNVEDTIAFFHVTVFEAEQFDLEFRDCVNNALQEYWKARDMFREAEDNAKSAAASV